MAVSDLFIGHDKPAHLPFNQALAEKPGHYSLTTVRWPRAHSFINVHLMSSAEYPLGTVALYGPTDKFATKLVANVYRQKAQPSIAMKKWNSESIDIREDADIRDQLTAFLKQHSVARAVLTEEVVGCPHEPGVDYPAGTTCPFCPFWANRQHTSAPSTSKSPAAPGRNDPCVCGSGRKYKKCCGA